MIYKNQMLRKQTQNKPNQTFYTFVKKFVLSAVEGSQTKMKQTFHPKRLSYAPKGTKPKQTQMIRNSLPNTLLFIQNAYLTPIMPPKTNPAHLVPNRNTPNIANVSRETSKLNSKAFLNIQLIYFHNTS